MSGKPNIASRRRSRSLLVQALYQRHLAETEVNALEAQFRAENEKSKVDWPYFHEVLHQVPVAETDLDEKLAPLLDRKVEELTPVELSILRLGMFELVHRIDVPWRVVINEYVELARKFGATESHKYINGVLDKAARLLREAEINAGA